MYPGSDNQPPNRCHAPGLSAHHHEERDIIQLVGRYLMAEEAGRGAGGLINDMHCALRCWPGEQADSVSEPLWVREQREGGLCSCSCSQPISLPPTGVWHTSRGSTMTPALPRETVNGIEATKAVWTPLLGHTHKLMHKLPSPLPEVGSGQVLQGLSLWGVTGTHSTSKPIAASTQ